MLPTKVHQNKKRYNRKKAKAALRKKTKANICRSNNPKEQQEIFQAAKKPS